ncbi:hypothetical protein CCACVL1_03830 [Corchorus capsularis]|uniref:Uncharacterized protein n=1 Tax=Corchorus capsularis TaxID=210143 RepID=A0A1R3JWZ3_COCAP|nr:hypothetical protein CCACVL1_03830 [Corchorus capsularis]
MASRSLDGSTHLIKSPVPF